MVYIGGIESILTTSRFEDWLRGLKDGQGKARVLARIRRLSLGNTGDMKSLGKGIYELRIRRNHDCPQPAETLGCR